MHDPIACGVIHDEIDTDGYQVIRRRVCVCGFSVIDKLSDAWKPREFEPLKPCACGCGRFLPLGCSVQRQYYSMSCREQLAKRSKKAATR